MVLLGQQCSTWYLYFNTSAHTKVLKDRTLSILIVYFTDTLKETSATTKSQ